MAPAASYAVTRSPLTARTELCGEEPASVVFDVGMRRLLKFLHTLASCGLIGAVLCYAAVLAFTSQEAPLSYAGARRTISTLCDYILLPSLAIALLTGLLSMAVHRPFQDTRWAWLKALLGLSLFEATLAIIQSKATTASAESAKIAAGQGDPALLATVLANEWWSLGAILTLSIAQVALGIWRPRLSSRYNAH